MADIKALARLPQIRERFKRAMNMKVVTDKSGHGFQFRLPGFKYDDFDRAGYVNPAKLNRMMETFRYLTVSNMDNDSAQQSNSLYFLFGNHLTITDALYSNASINYPLLFDGRPINVGRSSIDYYHRLFLDTKDPSEDLRFYVPKEENLLSSRLLRIVCVDRIKQESLEIPEGVRTVLSHASRCASEYGAVAEFPKVNLPNKVPENAFSTTFYPRFSDMDALFHVNQGAYPEFCLDTTARAAKAGALKQFGNDDVCFRKLRTATGLYAAESFPSNNLTASVWEDPDDPTVALYFSIRRTDNKQPIYRARFVFQPETEIGEAKL